MNLSTIICKLVAPPKSRIKSSTNERRIVINTEQTNVTIAAASADIYKLDDSLLHQLKGIIKDGTDAQINEVHHYLSIELTNKNNLVRLRALYVIDHFIHRSKYFRQLICINIRTIAQCVGLLDKTNSNNSSSINSSSSINRSSSSSSSSRMIRPPYSSELLDKGKELLEVWDHLYGSKHTQLHALARYCRESLNMDMPNIIENAVRHQQVAESNRMHSKRMILVKKEQILQKDWKDAFDEWHQSIKCIEECFSILFPSVYSHPNRIDDDDRSDDRMIPADVACYEATRVETTVKASNAAAAVEEEEEEEVESVESLDGDDDDDDDAAMSPYHQDESGVEWVEGDDDDNVHGDGDDDDNQKTNADEFNTHDVDTHHVSMRSEDASVHAYNPEEEEEEEEEEFDDGSMPTGAVPYSLKIILSTSAKSIESSDNAVLVQLIREVSTSLARFAVPKLKLWQLIFENALRIYNEDIVILRNDDDDVLIDDTSKGEANDRDAHDHNHNDVYDDDYDMEVGYDRKRKHSSTGRQITTDYTTRSSSSGHPRSSSRSSNSYSSSSSTNSTSTCINNNKMTTSDKKIPTITQHVSLKTLMNNKMKCIQCIDQIKAVLDQMHQLLTGKCKTFLK